MSIYQFSMYPWNSVHGLEMLTRLSCWTWDVVGNEPPSVSQVINIASRTEEVMKNGNFKLTFLRCGCVWVGKKSWPWWNLWTGKWHAVRYVYLDEWNTGLESLSGSELWVKWNIDFIWLMRKVENTSTILSMQGWPWMTASKEHKSGEIEANH